MLLLASGPDEPHRQSPKGRARPTGWVDRRRYAGWSYGLKQEAVRSKQGSAGLGFVFTLLEKWPLEQTNCIAEHVAEFQPVTPFAGAWHSVRLSTVPRWHRHPVLYVLSALRWFYFLLKFSHIYSPCMSIYVFTTLSSLLETCCEIGGCSSKGRTILTSFKDR